MHIPAFLKCFTPRVIKGIFFAIYSLSVVSSHSTIIASCSLCLKISILVILFENFDQQWNDFGLLHTGIAHNADIVLSKYLHLQMYHEVVLVIV